MDLRRKEIGRRLKAYRIGSGLKADEIARRLGISRAALYRMEDGEIVKLETLEALARVLNTSLASLLGVGVEYYSRAAAYFERMRQLETGAEQIVAHFAPVSQLITTPAYPRYLRQMLVEALPASEAEKPSALAEIDGVMSILGARREAARRPRIVSLIAIPEIERFLQLGLIGRFDLPVEERAKRRQAARVEIEHVVRLLEKPADDIELAVVPAMPPNATFQLFQNRKETVVAASSYRLGELPNIRFGVATVTAAPEAVAIYAKLADELLATAIRGQRAAARLREVLARDDTPEPRGRKAARR